LAACAVAAAAVVAGCAAVPTSGSVRQAGAGQIGSGQEQDYSQPIPVGPGPGWNATQVVSGFLAASASFAHDHAVAREYLDRSAQRSWRPGWAVTVVSSLKTSPATIVSRPLPGQPDDQPEQFARVTATGLPVATLTGTGQYLVSSGSNSESYNFYLIKINSQWRIVDLPTSQLLLTQADFQHVYQPRNLYFLTQSGRTLVPDPVFVPQQATNTELATGLVTALLARPRKGWLSGAAATAFPPNARLTGQVRINGPNATVDLGGKSGKALVVGQDRLAQMAAQLVWTLGSGPIQSVALQLNGRTMQIMGSQYQLMQAFHQWVPAQPAGSSLYFIGSNGIVGELSGSGQESPGRVGAVPGAAGAAGGPPLGSIAVSPDRRWIAGISPGAGRVYIGELSRGAALQQWRPPGGSCCTSVSWDGQDDLWIAAGGTVWRLSPGTGYSPTPLVPVSVAPGDEVTEFRVAPDGVRAAMIVRGASGTQVQLAAITRSGTTAVVGQPVTIGSSIPDPESLSWFGPGDVIVLYGTPSGPQLDEVPLNGGQPTLIPTTDGYPVSVTATSPMDSASDIAVGLSDGKIMISANQGAFEPARAAGLAPVYPG